MNARQVIASQQYNNCSETYGLFKIGVALKSTTIYVENVKLNSVRN